jgi:hypothetical protein
MPTATKPLEISLLVCPECRKPSKVDAVAFHSSKGAKSFCSGPIGDGHKRRRCVPVTFREVLS